MDGVSRERLRRALEAELESLRDLGAEFVSGAHRPGAAASRPAPAPSATKPVPAAAPATLPAATTAAKAVAPANPVAVSAELGAIADRVRECRLCPGLACRKNAVPGEGPPSVDLLFIGEAPGADEDEQGRPFVGRAGQLLTKMIEAIRFRREDVFIANVLKCRPPDNRPPQPDEIANCFPYLTRQIALLAPKVVCTLGLHASQTVLASKASMGQLRGRVFELGPGGPKVVPTYHPAYLLRSPGEKAKAWEDLKKVAALLGRPL